MPDPRIEIVAKRLNAKFAERAAHPSVWEEEDEAWKAEFRAEAVEILADLDNADEEEAWEAEFRADFAEILADLDKPDDRSTHCPCCGEDHP